MIDASADYHQPVYGIERQYQTSFLYITHDLATAYYISDYIAVIIAAASSSLGTMCCRARNTIIPSAPDSPTLKEVVQQQSRYQWHGSHDRSRKTQFTTDAKGSIPWQTSTTNTNRAVGHIRIVLNGSAEVIPSWMLSSQRSLLRMGAR